MHRSSLSLLCTVLTAASLCACSIQGPGPDEDPTPGNDDGFAADPAAEPEPGNEAEPGPGDLTPPEPDPEPDPGTTTEPDPDPPQQNGPPQVCYPGPAQDYTVCFPVIAKSSSFGSAYNYPSHSSAAYQPPQRFLDLTQHAASTKLAPNFSLGELMQEWKGDYAVYQVHMVEKLQTLRNQTGGALNVNSGYRSPAYNSSVGGATYSRHMYGDAADMHSSVVSLNSMKTRCNNLGADYVGMYTSHIHCDWRYSTKDPAFYGSAQMDVSPGPSNEPYEAPMTAQLNAQLSAALTIPLHSAIVGVSEGAWYADASGFDEGEPYREWTAYDAEGGILEVVASTSYLPPPEAAWVEVMIGGRVALRSPVSAPAQAVPLAPSQVVVRLDTLADHPERASDFVSHAH